VGDAFGGLSVPWHLTTTEFLAEIDRVLRPGGVYVMNVIDGGDNRFVQAELATLAQHFTDRAAFVAPDFPRRLPSNQILVAADGSIPSIVVDPADGRPVIDFDRYSGDGMVLRDDFAPVEQLTANF
jgi:SAM-dependent methyltransferase